MIGSATNHNNQLWINIPEGIFYISNLPGLTNHQEVDVYELSRTGTTKSGYALADGDTIYATAYGDLYSFASTVLTSGSEPVYRVIS